MDRFALVGFGTVGRAVIDQFFDGEMKSVESIVVSDGFEESIPKDFRNLAITWEKFLKQSPQTFILCIGYQDLNYKRKTLFLELIENGHFPMSLVHENAFVSKSAILEPGSIIFPGVVVENHARVGTSTFIWSNSVVGHESQVGPFSFVSANASIGGSAVIGERCLLGLHSTLGNKVNIGDRCLIGAGTLTTKSVPSDSVVIRRDDELFDWPSSQFMKLTGFDNVN